MQSAVAFKLNTFISDHSQRSSRARTQKLIPQNGSTADYGLCKE